ncbi:Uncharacterised protein [Mycobacterium tuberculosis]|nr:Uncharacterised protein [Mycobacterium tuberculosis]CNU73033.1 Uncharacterised protein [Mycobacterium tuberculosis]COW51219.1 Uncharacterised protein [Mycobacterium tuberculosis]
MANAVQIRLVAPVAFFDNTIIASTAPSANSSGIASCMSASTAIVSPYSVLRITRVREVWALVRKMLKATNAVIPKSSGCGL